MSNYYEILEISSNATEVQIKSAYRTMAKKYHPDKNAGNLVYEEKFKKINEAYSILSDPEKREIYNWRLSNQQAHAQTSQTYEHKTYYQPHARPPSNTNNTRQFVVRESALINGIYSGILMMIVIGLGATGIMSDGPMTAIYYFFMLLLSAAAYFPAKQAYQKPEILRINSKGIYYKRKLVTGWNAYHFAYLTEGNDTDSDRNDGRLYLALQYYSVQGLVEVKLHLPNSQDKSGYQVMDAIAEFKWY